MCWARPAGSGTLAAPARSSRRRGVATCIAVAFGLAAGAPARASVAPDEPPYASQILHLRLDDPRAGVRYVQERLADAQVARDPVARFWLHLGLTELEIELEHEIEAKAALAAARQLLDSGAVADAPRARLWLRMREIGATTDTLPVDEEKTRLVAFETDARRAGDIALLCHATNLRAFVDHAAEANPEAWAVAEEAERCATTQHEPRYAVWALYWRAVLANRTHGGTPARLFLDHANALMKGLPARQLRANMLRVMAEVAVENHEPAQAMDYFRQMLEIHRQLGDDLGAGAALTEIARLQLSQGEPVPAMATAAEAVRYLQPPAPVYRWVIAQGLLVQAMTERHQPGLAVELARLRDLDQTVLTLREKAEVAMWLSRGEASLGQVGRAYADLQAYSTLTAKIAAVQQATEVRKLAARYDAAEREAANVELRHRAETARLELAARDARQRALIAALIALASLLTLAVAVGWRIAASRRRMTDLAMRDELTGASNRRAVLAYATQQFVLAKRLGLPLSLAIIDLDHFKRVNDDYGHGVGDAVLKAFVRAAAKALRGQDLLGRIGGEEWLLIMPGTEIGQVQDVYARLRESFRTQAIAGMKPAHNVTFSMGAVSTEDTEGGLEALIAEADLRLYAVKRSGRNAVRATAVQSVAAA